MKKYKTTKHYVPLTIREAEKIIKLIKDTFESELASQLILERVSAPLVVAKNSGLQDDLTGVERKVEFDIFQDGKTLEIVQSLAKWKRVALKEYGYECGEGLYADMSAIRRDENLDAVHSIYVDQWDWEKSIKKCDRTMDFLKQTVLKIVKAICKTQEVLMKNYNNKFASRVCREVYFITSEELLKKYPHKTSKEREEIICKEHGTVFIMQIGHKLSDGKVHDERAADYDDWMLNGDLLIWAPAINSALEISSMGIRVDAISLSSQLKIKGEEDKRCYEYHKAILQNKLPLSMGGGIGQSRLCMLLMQQAHIGQVQASYWNEETLVECKNKNIKLL